MTIYLVATATVTNGDELTLPFCSFDCAAELNLEVRRDDRYEFDERCFACGAVIRAFDYGVGLAW